MQKSGLFQKELLLQRCQLQQHIKIRLKHLKFAVTLQQSRPILIKGKKIVHLKTQE